jgi:hypothetical protein
MNGLHKPDRRSSLAISVVSIILVFALAVGASYALSLYAINQSTHRWCTTLSLLTSEPAPKPAHPGADPSRERAYLFYLHLKDLEHQFRC